jgi:3-deoxy-D-manno-octulosonic-acid transferase
VAGVERQRAPSTNATGGSPRLDPSHPPAKVLLVDTIGELSAWWGATQIAFVGGSFGERGGQNMIEPAAYGAAVSFGPNTWNFRDIVAALTAADASLVVQNADQLEAFVRRCLTDPQSANAIGARAQQLVQSQLGATRRTVALLDALVPSKTGGTAIRSAA